jgi:hypothetical protein
MPNSASGALVDDPPKGGDAQGMQFDADLANIDFGAILGGPLTAAITAQAQAAMVTANFIQNVGFKPATADSKGQTLETATFDYTRSVVDPKTNVVTQSNESLTVPLLSIIPVPYIRVQQLSVSLQVKLNSINKSDSSSSITSTTNTGSSGGGFFDFFSPVKFDCTVTTQNSSSNSQQVTEDYNLDVKMLAVQDEMPAGLAKVLGILESLIQPVPAT